MADSDTKVRQVEEIYTEVVERLDAATKLFSDFRNSLTPSQQINLSQGLQQDKIYAQIV